MTLNLLKNNKVSKVVKLTRLANNKKEISTQISSQLFNIQVIIIDLLRINNKLITELVISLLGDEIWFCWSY